MKNILNSSNYLTSGSTRFFLEAKIDSSNLVIIFENNMILNKQDSVGFINLFNNLCNIINTLNPNVDTIILNLTKFGIINSSAILLLNRVLKAINKNSNIQSILIKKSKDSSEFIESLLPQVCKLILTRKSLKMKVFEENV